MNNCYTCNVKIENNTDTCPLCGQVIKNNITNNNENNFPNEIHFIDKNLRIANKIISFIFIIILFLNVLILVRTGFNSNGLMFSILPITYLYLTTKIQIANRKNLVLSLFMNIMMLSILLFSINIINTRTDLWSLKYVIPILLSGLLIVYDIMSVIKKAFLFDIVPYLFTTSIINIIITIFLYSNNLMFWPGMTMLFLSFSNIVGIIMFSNKKNKIALKMKFHV